MTLTITERKASQGAGADERIARYADGFGNWHADVPATFASPIIAARAAIRYELWLRSPQTAESLAELSAYVRKSVRLSERQDRAGYLRFEEH